MGKRRHRIGDRLADVVEGFDKGVTRGLRGKKKSKKRRRRNERQLAELSTQVTALTQAVAQLTDHVGSQAKRDKGSA
ncbi:hypothetical protein [Streptomyces sp. NPDC016675]|uniref:hypothetical protein n=1 Tax=Streptomyces sp. NPDC016675 TaxID=3364970 RepID=UPI0036F4E890